MTSSVAALSRSVLIRMCESLATATQASFSSFSISPIFKSLGALGSRTPESSQSLHGELEAEFKGLEVKAANSQRPRTLDPLFNHPPESSRSSPPTNSLMNLSPPPSVESLALPSTPGWCLRHRSQEFGEQKERVIEDEWSRKRSWRSASSVEEKPLEQRPVFRELAVSRPVGLVLTTVLQRLPCICFGKIEQQPSVVHRVVGSVKAREERAKGREQQSLSSAGGRPDVDNRNTEAFIVINHQVGVTPTLRPSSGVCAQVNDTNDTRRSTPLGDMVVGGRSEVLFAVAAAKNA